MNFDPVLKRFARRVRFLRAWVGLGVGLSLGGLVAIVWSVLDWVNVYYTTWAALGWLVAGCGLLGLLVGAIRSVPRKALADSIDRRADLQNRLSTANERTNEHGSFDEALQADANGKLQTLRPANLYPIRLNKWHAGALVFSLIAASLFMLGNTPLLLSKSAKDARAKMQEQAAAIQHVVKPLDDEAKNGEANPDEKKLAEELKKLGQELQKARLSPEEAMRRENELSKQAEKLADQRFQQSQHSQQTAQSAMDQMQKDEQEKLNQMKQNPLDGDMHSKNDELQSKAQQEMQNSNLSDSEKQALQQMLSQMQESQKQSDDLQKQIDDLNKQLQNPNLTAKQKADLLKQLAAMQKKLQTQMALTKSMQEALEKMMNDPLMKEIRELAAKAQIVMQHAQSGDQQQQDMSKEEMKELQKEMDDFAKKLLSDDKLMKQYLEAIRDMLKNGKLYLSDKQCMNPFSIPMELPIPGAPTKDTYFANTGYINKGKGETSQGKTYMTSVTGQSRDVPGKQIYIETRGPSGLGMKTTIPYKKVLPSYRQKADEAMNRQEIPPQHQLRVKKYFESLGQ